MKKTLGVSAGFRLILFCLIFLAIALIGNAKSEKPSERRKNDYHYFYECTQAIVLCDTKNILVRNDYKHLLFVGSGKHGFSIGKYVKPKRIEHPVSIPRQYKLEVLSNDPPYGQAALYYDPAKWEVGHRGGWWVEMLEALPAVKPQGINTTWPVWKTIQLGTHKSNEALRQALDDDEYIRIFDEGGDEDDILKRITVAPQPTEIKLVVVTIAQLGFPNGATRAQIYKKALSLSLQLCPAEVGPQLRLQYMDQPIWEYIIVGMEPISFSDGRPRMLGVVNGPIGHGLYGYDGSASHFWTNRYRWVFCQHFIDHKK